MFPQAWAVVNTIPMLVSGKLDRKLVKNWLEEISEQLHQQIVGAEKENDATIEITGVIATLRDIWAQVLNQPVDKINLNSSFLSLGMLISWPGLEFLLSESTDNMNQVVIVLQLWLLCPEAGDKTSK